MWITFSFLSAAIIQRYLRRFYDLPAGLQGRQSVSSTFKAKVKEMQEFFKLEVSKLQSSHWLCRYKWFLQVRWQYNLRVWLLLIEMETNRWWEFEKLSCDISLKCDIWNVGKLKNVLHCLKGMKQQNIYSWPKVYGTPSPSLFIVCIFSMLSMSVDKGIWLWGSSLFPVQTHTHWNLCCWGCLDDFGSWYISTTGVD